MTPDRTDANPDENAEHGVLDESGNLDTASITILGGYTAQVSVDLPATGDDDDLDDDVIEDEIPFDDADLAALDDSSAPRRLASETDDDEVAAQVDELATDEIILEPHPDDAHHDGAHGDEPHRDAGSVDDDVHDAEVVGDDPEGPYEAPAADGSGDDARDDDQDAAPAEHEGAGPVDEGAPERDAVEHEADGEASHDDASDDEGDVERAEYGDDRQDDLGGAPAHDDVEDVDAEASVTDDAGVEAGDVDATTPRASADERSLDEHPDTAHESLETVPGTDAPAPDDAISEVGATPDEAPEDAAASDDLHDVEVVDDVELYEADAAEPFDEEPFDEQPLDEEPFDEEPIEEGSIGASAEPLTHAPWVPETGVSASADETDDEVVEAAIDDDHDDEDASDAGSASESDDHARATDDAVLLTARVAEEPASAPTGGARPQTGATTVPAPTVPAAAAAAAASPATRAVPTGSVPTTRAERAATGVIGTVPLTRRQAHQADDAARTAEEAARVDRAHAMERVRTPAPEVALTSKRIGQIDDSRESADLLTADRLLDPKQISRPEPEGLWQQLVYSASRHRINLGDGRRARQRKELDRRISAPLAGGARFVPVLSRKGGVGKTTVTSLLGMALADARDDRIIAVDANPDRGTLADRVGRPNGRTVRDLVRAHDEMAGYNDVSSIVARDATRLDVLASDADPRQSEAFSDDDYRQVADVAAHYYSIVLTDTGTGIVHSVMGATLELADTLVIVAGLSVDEARLASETLTWLETNGYAARVRDAVVVLNNSRPGAPLVRESELESHFRSRVRTVIRMPYDARIAAGSAITFRDLQPGTRQAARELAAAVVEGLRAPVASA
ncbi:MinD/ParA family protein [Microbacterium sp. NPDC089180]|uniref:nucleotide-binding protein n=1 Tax=unclassified Microbacterium TaxID=2609290 RepID=UPI0034404070